MRTKLFRKILTLSLLGFSLSLTGCSSEEVETTSFLEELATPIDKSFLEEEKEEVVEEKVEEDICEEVVEEIDTDSLEYNSREQAIVVALMHTDIFDKDGNKIGAMAEGSEFVLLAINDDNYLIDYYGKDGYICKENIYKTTRRVIDGKMINKGYLPEASYIYDSKDLSNPFMKLNKLEFVEIYKEYEDSYLVQTIDTIGFVPKSVVEILEGDVAVTDLSNQELRLYEGNELTVCTPVVTGTKDTARATPEGLFKVHTKAKGYFDIQPGYKVECVLYYDSNRGIHTAEWRDDSEFGGDTYFKSGSHGCTNTPREEALYIYERLDKGELVLVKNKNKTKKYN